MSLSANKLSIALSISIATLLTTCGTEENQTAATSSTEVTATTQPVAVSTASSAPELGSFGIDMSHQDTNTQPGNDFFRYANGLWLDTFELPAYAVTMDHSQCLAIAPTKEYEILSMT